MRVLSYNTLFGGWDGNEDRRFQLQAEIVTGPKPDVLLVQEAKQFESGGGQRLYQVEAAFQMRAFLAVAPHTGQNTAIFVREGIRPVSFEADAVHFHHAAAFGAFRVPGVEQPVTFISAHLCPFGPEVRLREASYLVNHAAPDRFTLLAGDFNSVSPFDPEPALSELPGHFRARYASADGKTADRRVLQLLYHAGFEDIAHRFNRHTDPTVPGAAFKGTEFVQFRSDYILTSAALAEKAVAYEVIKNDQTDKASDHYPILAEFNL
jgi:exodeoxyribonuclease-3